MRTLSWLLGLGKRVSIGGLSTLISRNKHFLRSSFNLFGIDLFLRKIQLTPLKFQEFFNLNSKVLKLAVYIPEVSKSSNLNLPSTFSVKLDGEL